MDTTTLIVAILSFIVFLAALYFVIRFAVAANTSNINSRLNQIANTLHLQAKASGITDAQLREMERQQQLAELEQKRNGMHPDTYEAQRAALLAD